MRLKLCRHGGSLAVVFGALAVAAPHSQQANAQKLAVAAQNKQTPTAMNTIVVADSTLRFGSKLSKSVLNYSTKCHGPLTRCPKEYSVRLQGLWMTANGSHWHL